MEPDSELNREVETLRAENLRLKSTVSLLSDLGRRITSSLDLAVVLQSVVEAACELTNARYGALAVFDSQGRIFQFYTHGISQTERENIGEEPKGAGVLGILPELDKPLRLADLTQHASYVGFPANHPPMRSFLGIPLLHGGESLGNLYLSEKKLAEKDFAQEELAGSDPEFTSEDESLLAMFADQASIAIHNAKTYQGAQVERLRLQAFVDTSPVGVVVVDTQTKRMVSVNREAERILGKTHQADELLGYYRQGIVYRRPDGREYTTEELPLQRSMDMGESVRAEEITLEFPDGRSLPTLVNATPVYSSEGEVTAAIGVIQDLTPVAEVERLRSEFLGIVSHELRTPLTAIKGSAATVLGSRKPVNEQEAREFFEIIDEQADRLRDLVDNLLDMTRIEAGSLSVSVESSDLAAMLAEASSEFQHSDSLQELELQIQDDLPQVHADSRRIVQVLTNLLSNAAKFSPVASPISINVAHDGIHVTVQIRDRGRGIPKDRLPHLFRKFSRVHSDAGRGLAGTGLGLAICKGIIEAHGGRIWADSAGTGRGATFSFTLPVATAPASEQRPSTAQRTEHLGRVSRPGERTKILAVDADGHVLRYLQKCLEEEGGYQTIVTDQPERVMGILSAEEPDLVLLDVVLPGTSGYQVLQDIREVSGVPVVFLTAKDREEDMVNALKSGADDYITKPFSPSELLARIEVSLRRRLMPDQIEVRPQFTLGDLTLNFGERRVMVGEDQVSLSATEYKVLYELATHAGLVLTHDQILHRVWGPEYSGETDLVRSFIRNLRRKLGDDARNPSYIFTEPQVGYRMPRPT